MSAVLNLKPEEIDTAEKRGKYTVSVIGCGQKSILYAVAFAEAGFKVICVDADQSIVKRVAKGKMDFSERATEAKLKRLIGVKQLSVTSELKSAVSQSDIIVMTVAAKIDDKKSLNYAEVENSCKQVGAALRHGALFIYVGTAGLGFNESVIKETLENTSGLRVGEDFGLAYNPLLCSGEQPVIPISSQEFWVAALDKKSLEAASMILATLSKCVRKIMDFKTAELAVLFTAAKKDAETALANELAIFCESAGVDYSAVVKLVDLQDSNLSPTIAEERNRKEAYFLLENAENLNTKLRLSKLARQINEEMVKHTVNIVQNALRSCGKTMRRARVAALGTVKQGTAADRLVKMLEKKGAKMSVYDPLLGKNETLSTTRALKRSLNEAVESADCLIILNSYDQFKRLNFQKLRAVMRIPAAIVDLVGLVEPQKVEKEGFIYRCLGRGDVKK
ncbi:nucleotide sugar dehydrogenase [Candidatus Bathyarchaeota archaeon A05DMB-2]|jgi:UDP-N-acetyl-D-mannosaminuronic acid dehydrogenase|nr:nucleotide sugar dehydrogenase [Candidatus Bathyarchaeota archaeon A05DMB-2]